MRSKPIAEASIWSLQPGHLPKDRSNLRFFGSLHSKVHAFLHGKPLSWSKPTAQPRTVTRLLARDLLTTQGHPLQTPMASGTIANALPVELPAEDSCDCIFKTFVGRRSRLKAACARLASFNSFKLRKQLSRTDLIPYFLTFVLTINEKPVHGKLL